MCIHSIYISANSQQNEKCLVIIEGTDVKSQKIKKNVRWSTLKIFRRLVLMVLSVSLLNLFSQAAKHVAQTRIEDVACVTLYLQRLAHACTDHCR